MAVIGYATVEAALPEASAVDEVVQRCVAAGEDREALKAALTPLRAMNWPRAELSCALLVVDLVRLGDDDARRWLPDHTPSLLAAWRNPQQGALLLGGLPALEARWERLVPLLESFDAPYLDAAVNACFQLRTDEQGLRIGVESLGRFRGRRAELARCLFNLELVRLGVNEAKPEFASRVELLREAYLSPETAEQLIGGNAGLKALWDDVKPYLEEFFEGAATADEPSVIELGAEELGAEELGAEELGAEELAAAELAEEVSMDDIEQVEDAPPRLPPPPPKDSRTPEERAFWQKVERSLLPPPGHAQISARLFDTSDREQRKRLATLAQAAATQFPDVACAKAFACLLQLYLAVQAKDKSLFGKPNPARREALASGLALLSGNAPAAARAAVFFVLDGAATVDLLSQGLDQVYRFLGFCASRRMDPLNPASVAAYLD